MLRMRNNLIALAWADGNAACNHKGTFWTDGVKLYSYQLQIGDTDTIAGLNVKVLRDYSAKGRHGFKSMTTSQHVGKARTHADIVD